LRANHDEPSRHYAPPYPVGIGHDESCKPTNPTLFGGHRGMLLGVNLTPLTHICAGTLTEGNISSLAVGKGGHQKKTDCVSSYSPIFTRAPSLERLKSHNSSPYPISSSGYHREVVSANSAGHHSSPATVEYDQTSTTMTNISQASRSNQNRQSIGTTRIYIHSSS